MKSINRIIREEAEADCDIAELCSFLLIDPFFPETESRRRQIRYIDGLRKVFPEFTSGIDGLLMGLRMDEEESRYMPGISNRAFRKLNREL